MKNKNRIHGWRRTISFWCMTAVIAVFLLPLGARAATYQWTGTSSGNMSGTTGNWSPATVPGSGDIAEWNASSYVNAPTANANMTIGELWFGSSDVNGVTFGAGTSTLTLNGVGGIGIQIDSGSGAVSLGSAKLALGGSQAWNNNSANTLTITGTINLNANILTNNGTGTITQSGIMSGAGGLVMNSGTLNLNGANTFTTGGVKLNGGTLVVGNTKALGNGGTFTINGGTLDAGSAGYTLATVGSENWNGNFTFGGSGALNLSTAGVTLGTNVTVTANGSILTVGGIINDGTNTYSLTKAGSGGTLLLSGANTFKGGVTNSAGTLQIGVGSVGTISSITSSALGTGGLTLNGGKLSADATTARVILNAVTFGGDVTLGDSVNTGALTFSNTWALGGSTRTLTVASTVTNVNVISGGSSSVGMTMQGSGTLVLGGANTYQGTTTLGGGTLVANVADVASTSGALGNGGNITFTGGTLQYTAASAGTDYSPRFKSSTAAITLNDGGQSVTLAGNIDSSNTGGLTKLGSGTVRLNGANNYSGGTTIGQGVLSIAGTGSLPGYNQNYTAGSAGFIVSNGATLAVGNSVGDSALGTILGTTNFLAGASIGFDTTAGNRSYSTAIANGVNGALGVVVLGGNTLTLSGANSYTGATTLKAGTLIAGNSSALGSGTTLTLSGGTLDWAVDSSIPAYNTTVNGTVTIQSDKATAGTAGITNTLGTLSIGANTLYITNGTTLAANSAYGVTFGTTTFTTNGTVFDVENNGTGLGTLTLSNLTGPATNVWTKQGPGQLTLVGTGANNSRTNTLTAGTLQITYTATRDALGPNGATVIMNGGTLDLAVDGNLNAHPIIMTANGTIQSDKATAGSAGITNTLGALSIGTDQLNITAGASLQANSAYGVTMGAVTLNGNPIFDVANNGTGVGTLTLGALANAYQLTKQDAGVLVLTGSGGNQTRVLTNNAGTVVINYAATRDALGAAGSSMVLNGGTLDMAADTTLFAHNTTVGGNVIIQSDKQTAGSAGITNTLGTLSIGANTLYITNGATLSANSAYGVTFGATTLTGSPVFNVANNGTGVGTLTLAAITGGGNSITLNGNGNFAQTGVFSGTGSGLTLGAGYTGTATLNQANSYSGGTIISGGTLDINNATALGNVAGAFTIAGGTIDNTTAAPITNSNNNAMNWNGDFTFTGTTNLHLGSGAVTLNAARTVTVNANTLTVGGTISGASLNALDVTKAGNGTLALTANVAMYGNQVGTVNAGTTLLSGIISDGGSGYSLTKAGSGTLTLAGANTYSGGTTNSAGTLQLSGSGTLGNINNALVVNGGTVDLNGTSQSVDNFAGTGGIVTNSGASASTLTIGVNNGTGGNFAGIIGDNAGGGGTLALTKAGTGTLTLSGANTYTGATTVNAGGTLALSGANGSIAASAVTLQNSAATLTIDNTTSKNNRLGGQNFTANGGTLNLNNPGAAQTESIGTLTLNNGALTVNSGKSSGTSTTTIGSITRNAGGTVLFSGTGLGTSANKISFTSSPTLTSNILPYAVIGGSSSDLVTVIGGVVTNYTGYYQPTGVNTGLSSWVASSGTNIRPQVSFDFNGDASVNSLTLDNGINMLKSGTTAHNLFLTNGPQSMVYQTGGISTQGVNAQATLVFGASEGIFDVVGTLGLMAKNAGAYYAFTGSGGITKAGAGTLILGSDAYGTDQRNSETGVLNLNQGLFEIYAGNVAALNTFAGINFNGGNFTIHDNGGTYAFNTPLTNNANSTITLDRRPGSQGPGMTNIFGNLTVNNTPNITLLAGANVTSGTEQMWVTNMTLNSPVTFTISNSAAGGAMALAATGAISDGGNNYGVTKAGNGILTLAGSNTFGGGVALNGGTLNINSTNALGTGAFRINGGTTIDNTSGAPITNLNNNAMAWNGNFIFTGSTNLHLGNGNVTLGNNVAISNVNGNALLTVGGNIGGAYALTVAGAGDLSLNGANTFSGGITVLTNAQLNINSTTALGATAGALTLNAGSTIDTINYGAIITNANNNPMTWNGNFAFGGSTTQLNLGTGLVTLSAPLTVTVGNKTLTAGGVISGNGYNALDVTAAGGGTLTLTAPVSMYGNQTNTVGGTETLSGIISDGGHGYGLTKAGTGTLTLSGNNTYTGSTLVSAGKLSVGNPSIWTNSSMVVVSNGASFAITAGSVANSEPFTLSGPGISAAPAANVGALIVNINGGAETFNGPITNNGGATICIWATSNNLTFAQGIVGTGDLTLVGSANNNSIGPTAFTLNGQSTYSGNTFVYTFKNQANSPTSLQGGALITLGINNALPTTTTLNMIGNSAALATNYVKVALNGNNQWLSGLISTNTVAGGINTNSIVGGAATLSVLTVSNAVNNIFDGQLGGSGVNENNLQLVKTGSGTLTLTSVLNSTNTYSGGTIINNGILNAGATNALGSGTITFGGGTLQYSAASAGSDWSAQFKNSASAMALDDGGQALTFTNVIDSSNTGGLTKLGAGSLMLSNNMAYSGGTLIQNGTLLLGVNNALPTADSGGVTISSGTLTLNGHNQTVATLVNTGGIFRTAGGSLIGTGSSIWWGGYSTNLINGTNGLNSSFVQDQHVVINDPTSLNMVSNGSLIVTTGSPGLVMTNGTLVLQSSPTSGAMGQLLLSNDVQAVGTAAINTDTSGAYSGLITLANGTRTFTVVGANDKLTIGAAIGDGGAGNGLTLAGNGTLILSGANNTYSGITTINSGTLLAHNASGSATGTNVVNVSSGATLGGDGTISGAVVVASGAVLKPGYNNVGTLTVGGLTLSNGCAVNFNFTKTTNTQVVVLNSNGLTIDSTGTVGLNFYQSGTTEPWDSGGLYNLFAYNGAYNGSTNNLTWNNPGSDVTGYSFTDTNGWITINISGGLSVALWNGGSTSIPPSGNWSDSGNWTGSPLMEGNRLLFDGNQGNINTNDLADGTRFAGMIFSNTAGAFTLYGNAIKLSGAVENLSPNVQTIALNGLVLTNGGGVFNAAVGGLVVSNAISEAGGPQTLTKNGANALTLAGANTFSGGLTLNAGTLNINNAAALGATAGTFLIASNGVAIDNTSGAPLTNVNNNAMAWNGDFTFTGTTNLNLGTGVVTLGNNRIVTVSNNTLTVGGAISDGIYSYGLTKAGPGMLVLSGTSTYKGGTTISNGTLQVSSAGNLGSGGQLTIDAGTLDVEGSWSSSRQIAISNALATINIGSGFAYTNSTGIIGNSTLTKTGLGTLMLSGVGNLNGQMVLNGGTLLLGAANALMNNGAVFVNSNATYNLGGFTTVTNGAIGLDNGGLITNGTLVSAAGFAVTNGTITANLGGAGTLTQGGAGTVVLAGSNTFSGGATLNSGILALDNTYALGTNTFVINGGALDAYLTGGQGTLTNKANNAMTWNSNFGFVGTTNLNLGTGKVNLGTGPIIVTVSNNTLTVGGIITNTGSLTVAGNGTLVLGGANTFTGGVTNNGGNIIIGNNTGFGAATGTLVINGGTVGATAAGYAAALAVNVYSDFSFNANAAGALTLSGTMDLEGGTRTITQNNTVSQLVTGVVQDGALIKAGSGWLTLGGANTFAGGLTIKAGTLYASGNKSLGGTGLGVVTNGDTSGAANATLLGGANTYTNPIVIASGSTGVKTLGAYGSSAAVFTNATITLNDNLALDAGPGTGSLNLGDNISGSGGLTNVTAGTGAVTLWGNNTFQGGVTLNSGLVRINGTNALGTGTFTINGGATIDTTYGAPLTNVNNNAMAWNGAFTFNGTTNLNLGNGAVLLGNSLTVTNTLNTLTVGGAISDTNGSGVSQSYSLTKAGAGTLTLAGANTYQGNTTNSLGTLRLANAVALQNSTLVMTGGTNVFDSAAGTAFTLGGLAATGAGAGYDIGLTNSAGTAVALTVGNNTSNTIYAGVLSQGGSLTKVGAGTLTLAGANTYTGGTTNNVGTLRLSGSGTLGNSTNNLAVNGGTVDLNGTSQNVGNLTGSGSVVTNSGTSASTLAIGNGNATGGNFAGVIGDNAGGGGTLALTKVGTGTLTVSGANTYQGGTTISNGTLSISAANNLGNLAGQLTINAGILDVEGSFGSTRQIAVSNAAAAINVGSTFAYTNSTGIIGSGGFTKLGSGTLVLTGTGSYLGGTTISNGTVSVSGASSLGVGQLTINAGTFDVEGSFGSSRQIAVSNTAAAISIGSGYFYTNSTGIIGTGALTLSGNGTLVLTGAASYTGATTNNAGTLQFSGSGTFGNANTNLIVNGGTVDLNGTSQGVGNFAGTGGMVTNSGASASTLTIGNNNGTGGDFSGVIGDNAGSGGTLALTKVGTGTLTLSGANTYTGTTTINAGTLLADHADVAGSGALGNGGKITFTGGTLQYDAISAGTDYSTRFKNSTSAIALNDGGQSVTLAGIIDNSNSGGLSKAGAGSLTLSGANTFNGGVTLSAGTLNINNAQALGTGTFTLAGGTIDNTSGAPLTNANNNAMAWNGNFSFAGTTNLNLGAGAVTISANRTVTVSNNTLSVNGAISGGTYTLTKAGAGELVLGGTSSIGGVTYVSNGALTIPNGGNLVDGSNIQVGNGAGYTGTLNIQGGTVSGAIFYVGESATGTGIVNQTSGTLNGSTGNNIQLGVAAGGGYGVYNLYGGTINNSGLNLYAGLNAYTTGIFNMVNGNLINGSLILGRPNTPGATNNAGFFYQSGGTATVTTLDLAGITGVASNSSIGGYLIISSGVFRATGFTDFAGGTSNTAVLYFGQGAQVTLPAFPTTPLGVGSTATVTFDGGSLSNTASSTTYMQGLSHVYITTNGAFFNVGAAITVSQNLENASADLSNIGNLTKLGGGTLTLAGANTYSGGTTIGQGMLSITGAGALPNYNQNGGFAVSNGATLAVQIGVGDTAIAGMVATTNFLAGANLGFDSSAGGFSSAAVISNGVNGALGVVVFGGNAVTNSGANSYTGTTAINAGTLNAGSATALGNGGNITFGGGTLQYSAASAGTDWSTLFKNSTAAIKLDDGGNTVVLNGVIDSSNSGGLTKAGAGIITLGGNNTFSGSVTLTAGTLTLAGANTYSGGTTLSAGTLNINNAQALGSGAFTISGGTIDNTSGAPLTNANNNAMNWNGNFTFAGTTNLNLGTGAVTLSAARTVTVNANTLTVDGAIGDGGSGYTLTKVGTGTLVLGATNTYTGATAVNAGTLTLAPGSYIYGSANQNLGATAGSYGVMRIDGGTVTNGANIVLGANATGTGIVYQTVGAVGAVTSIQVGGTSGAYGEYHLSGGTVNAGPNLYIAVNPGCVGLFDMSGGTLTATTLNVGRNTQVNTTGTYQQSGGTSTVTTLNISGSTATNVVGSLLISNGVFSATAFGTFAQGLNNTGTVYFGQGAQVALPAFPGSSAARVASNAYAQVTFDGGSLSNTVGSTSYMQGLNHVYITTNGAFFNVGTATAITVSQNLENAVGQVGYLTTTGNGTLALAGANTFSGGVTNNAGTLAINNAQALGTGALTINGGSSIDNTSGAVITNANGNLINLNGNFTFTGTTNLNLGTGNVTLGNSLTVTAGTGNNTNSVLTIGGNISGGGQALTVAGVGALALAGANTFSGGVTVQNGAQLNINSTTALGTGLFTINGGATIDNTSGAILTNANNNLMNWNGDFTFAGTTSLHLGNGAVTLGANRQVTVNANTLTVGGNIGDGSAGYSLTKAGNGTLTLSGTNTYTGATLVNGGYLSVGNGRNWTNTSQVLVANGATLQLTASQTNSVPLTLSGLGYSATVPAANKGALLMQGSGLYLFNGPITNNGGAAITLYAINDNATFAQGIVGTGDLTLIGSAANNASAPFNFNLNGQSTYSGNTYVYALNVAKNYGTVVTLGVDNALPTTTTLDLLSQNTTTNYVKVALNGHKQWLSGLISTNTVAGFNTNSIVGGSATLSVLTVSNAANNTFDGVLGGVTNENNLALVKTGSGTLTLTWTNNTFSGGVEVQAGTLYLNTIQAVSGAPNLGLGTGTITNDNGAILQLALGGFNCVLTNNIINNGLLYFSNNGAISNGVIGGTSAISGTGAVYLNAAQVKFKSANSYSGNTTNSTTGGGFNLYDANAISNSTLVMANGVLAFTGITTANFGGLQATSAGLGYDIGLTNATGSAVALAVGANGSNTTYAGILNDGGLGGSLTKVGTGTLTLSGANTHSGGTILSAGTLALGNASALGTGTFTINGGTLENLSGASLTNVNNNTMKWAGDFAFAGTSSLYLGTGAVTMSGNRTVTVTTNTLHIDGVIGDNASGYSLTKAGGSTLSLGGANTYSGNTTNSAGVLRLANALALQNSTLVMAGGTNVFYNTGGTAFTFGGLASASAGAGYDIALTNNAGAAVALTVGNNSNNTAYAGVLSDGGLGGSLIKIGTGTLNLSGANTYTGGTFINQGLLQLGADNALPTGSGVTISGGTLALNGHNQTVTTLVNNNYGTFRTGGGHLIGTGSSIYWTGGSTNIINSGSVQDGHIVISDSATLAVVTNGSLIVAAGGAGLFMTNSTLTLLDSDNQANVGQLILSNGVQAVGSARIGDPGNDVFHSIVDLGGGMQTFTVVNPSDTLRVGPIIQNGGLTVAGSGTLQLAGSNTFSGGTILSAGSTLDIENPYALGTGNFTINGGTLANYSGVTQGNLNNNTMTWAGDFAFAGTNNLRLGAGAVTLSGNRTVTVTTNALWVGGAIGDNSHGYSLTVAGNGTLGLGGANTFSGGTILSAGSTLDLENSSALGTGNFTINGGTLENLSGASLTNVNNNTMTWAGDFAFAGTNSLHMGTGAVTMSGNRIVTVNANTLHVDGVIGDSNNGYSLSKLGAGTLSLGGQSTYTGGTFITNGTVRLDVDNALPLNSKVYVDTLGILNLNGHNQSLTSLGGSKGMITNSSGTAGLTLNLATSESFLGTMTGPATLTLTGGGTLNVIGTNNFSYTTVTNGGSLAVNGMNGGVITVYTNSTVYGGAGVINNMVVNSGTYQPGYFTQTVANLTLTNSGTLTMALGTNGFSEVVATSSLALTNANLYLNLANYNLNSLPAFKFALVDWTAAGYAGYNTNQLFTLADPGYSWNGTTLTNGMTFSVVGGNLVGGNVATNKFEINYDDIANGHQITLTVIPEPGTASLLGLVGVAFLVRWRRQKNQLKSGAR